MGIITSAVTREQERAKITVIAKSPKRALVRGAVKERGRKTQMLVRVAAITAPRTSVTEVIITSFSVISFFSSQASFR